MHTTEAREQTMACYRAKSNGISKQQQPQQQSQQGQQPVGQQSGRHVVAHTHSCTFMHSQKQTHTHRYAMSTSAQRQPDTCMADMNAHTTQQLT
jgi:hypothetical protein